MIGLDTNVLVRYIMQDDPVQSARATTLIESLDAAHPGFVALVSIVELYGVLTSCYGLSDAQVASALEASSAPSSSWWSGRTWWFARCACSGPERPTGPTA